MTARETDERVEVGEPSPPVEEVLLQDEGLGVVPDATEGAIESPPIARVGASRIRHPNGPSGPRWNRVVADYAVSFEAPCTWRALSGRARITNSLR